MFAIMQEHAITVKSEDIGLRYEVHYEVKKHFEVWLHFNAVKGL